jgi:hypothetical protein
MATTTNYSWSTPDDTALVKDGASAIRTLGSSVDTTVKALNPETTLGDLAYRSSTANVKTRLGLGTAGQVLQVNSGATAPEWATASSGGMTLISTTSLTGSGVTISSIPATYRDIRLVAINVDLTSDTTMCFRFNADINANRHSNATSLSATDSFLASYSDWCPSVDNTVTTNLFIADIPEYANTTSWKTASFFCIAPNSSTPANWQTNMAFGVYNQTPAISSLNIFPLAGTFTSGTAYLYGVK